MYLLVPAACPPPRPLFATGERAAAAARRDLVPRWAGRAKKSRFLHRRETRLALLLLTLMVLARALPCLAARFSVHLLWTGLGSCSIQDPSPAQVHSYPRLYDYRCYTSSCAPRLGTEPSPCVVFCLLLFAQAKVLQTSITQDYIRPSAANLPPDRSPHTALA